jgi:hypothetical protein
MKRLLLIAVALAALAPLSSTLLKAGKYYDFSVYYSASQSLMQGRTDLYTPDFAGGVKMEYRYLPLFLLVFNPLGLLSRNVAAAVWFSLLLLSLAGCVFVVRRALAVSMRAWGTGAEDGVRWLWLIPFLVTGAFFINSLSAGNAQLIFVLLWSASFYFWLRGREGWSASLFALAVTLKIVPLATLPYFAMRRQWNFLGLAALFLVFFNLIPAAYFGFGRNIELVREWYDLVVANQAEHERHTMVNYTMKGQLERYLTQVDYQEKVRGMESTDVNYRAINMASLPPSTVEYLWRASAVAIYVFTLMLILWRGRGRVWLESGEAALEAGLMITCTLLIMPLAHKHYYTILLWPVTFLSYDTWTGRRGLRWLRVPLVLLAGASVVLPLVPGSAAQRLLQVIGVDFYVSVALFLLLVLRLGVGAYRLTRQAPEPEASGLEAHQAPPE